MFLIRLASGIVGFFTKLPHFIYWVSRDIRKSLKEGKKFNQYGLKMFCGRQGAGKSIGMVWYLEEIRQQFPKCKIYTNFDYIHQTAPLTSWRDFLDPELKNGLYGVIFAIDEIQNEFNSNSWKDFPETILSEVTQQRKQRMCILATSQVFTRVVKPLREQCFDVIECKTFANRWTRLKCYDAEDYNTIVESPSPERKFKLPKRWVRSFIQTDDLRGLFDSYAKIERMQRTEFIPRNERNIGN